MKNFAKKLLSKDLFLPFSDSRRFIFVYHDISDEIEKHFSGDQYSTTIDNFKRQISVLSRKFELIGLDSLVSDSNLSRKKHYASIVFDDGFASITETAFKILNQNQIPFAVFVNKSAILFDQLWVSNLVIHRTDDNYLQKVFSSLDNSSLNYKDFRSNLFKTTFDNASFDSKFRESYLYQGKKNEKRLFLSSDEIKELYNQGIIIGSHSTDHYPLSKCTKEELLIQINENKDFLKTLLKNQVEHFAVPFGRNTDYNEKVIETIFAAGHKFVYSTNIVPFQTNELCLPNFLFPRIVILNNSPEEIMFYINRTFLRKYDL